MQYDPLHQGIRYLESSYLDQDAAAIEQLRQNLTQQTLTFISNNINTSVHFDYMGLYVEGTLSEVRDVQ